MLNGERALMLLRALRVEVRAEDGEAGYVDVEEEEEEKGLVGWKIEQEESEELAFE